MKWELRVIDYSPDPRQICIDLGKIDGSFDLRLSRAWQHNATLELDCHRGTWWWSATFFFLFFVPFKKLWLILLTSSQGMSEWRTLLWFMVLNLGTSDPQGLKKIINIFFFQATSLFFSKPHRNCNLLASQWRGPDHSLNCGCFGCVILKRHVTDLGQWSLCHNSGGHRVSGKDNILPPLDDWECCCRCGTDWSLSPWV